MSALPNFIAGEWIAAAEGSENINPSNTRDVVGVYARASAADAERAIGAARQAFPAWSRSSIQERHDILKRVGDEIIARREEIGRPGGGQDAARGDGGNRAGRADLPVLRR
jgi:acyl-CoA reductase-like NAD-dependent aldehyde dehydrogenase